MKMFLFGRLLAAIVLCTGSAFATAESLPISPKNLAGKWYTSELHPEQGNIETHFIINADRTFSGTMLVNDAPAWQYAGTWTLEGNRITWVYLESDLILLQEDKQDTDVILSLTENKLTYRSLRRGSESSLQRTR